MGGYAIPKRVDGPLIREMSAEIRTILTRWRGTLSLRQAIAEAEESNAVRTDRSNGRTRRLAVRLRHWRHFERAAFHPHRVPPVERRAESRGRHRAGGRRDCRDGRGHAVGPFRPPAR